MKLLKFAVLGLLAMTWSCKDKDNTEKIVEIVSETTDELHKTTEPDALHVIPVAHATMVLVHEDLFVYVDPVGGAEAFSDHGKPDYVLVTDIHGDHMDAATLTALDLSEATLVVPKAVAEKLPEMTVKEMVVLNNGETKALDRLTIEAVPMYNLRQEALHFHEKGRGNGYILTLGDQRIYISGDTEDIPEMRALTNIDVAFVCMNLPYTMTVESAADAVLDFRPKKVYPYHYRGTDGLSDVERFKTLVNAKNDSIDVVQLNWYK